MKTREIEYVQATAKEVMDFFKYGDVAEFRADWQMLTEAEKQFFQAEVAKILVTTF